MADNEVKIKVSLNSDEAIAKFKELQKYVERLCGVKPSVGGGKTSGNDFSVTEAEHSASTTNGNAKKNGKELGNAAAVEMSKISDNIGRVIGERIFDAMKKAMPDTAELSQIKRLLTELSAKNADTRKDEEEDGGRAYKTDEKQETANPPSGNVGNNGGGNGGANPPNGNGNADTSASNDKDKKDGKNFGEAAANEIAKVSDRMGRLIGAHVFGAVRRMFADTTELNYLSNIHAGMNTFPIEKQYQQTNAMYGGLFGGAAAGFLMGGPLGAVAGGIGGAVYNHWVSGRKADEQQRLKEENVEFSTMMRGETSKIDLSRSIGRMALQRKMHLTGDREGQVRLLEDALSQVQFGEGEGSIDSLKKRRDLMLHGNEAYQHAQKVLSGELGDFFNDEEKEDAKKNRGKYGGQVAPTHDISSKEAQLIDKQINDAIGTQSELQMQIFQTKYLKQFVKPWEGADFADSFTTKGLYAGATVDMEKANEPIINQLKELNKAMEKFIHGMTDRSVQDSDGGPKAVLRAPAIYAP